MDRRRSQRASGFPKVTQRRRHEDACENAAILSSHCDGVAFVNRRRIARRSLHNAQRDPCTTGSRAHSRSRTLAQDQNYPIREASAESNPSEIDHEFTTRNPKPMCSTSAASPTSLSATTGRDLLGWGLLKQLDWPLRKKKPIPRDIGFVVVR